MPKTKSHQTILRMLCADAPGIISRITTHILNEGGNVLDLEQHVEEESNLFAMRLHVEGIQNVRGLEKRILRNHPFKDFQIWIDRLNHRKKVAVMVTKEDTCLIDLLQKQRLGELPCDIVMVISNREDLRHVAEMFSVPFFHVGIKNEDTRAQEEKVEKLLKSKKIDLVVLARYMRILSGDIVRRWQGKMINIHHSFLPAFKGANPYRQAWERGVKMIGATAHYVTEDLDEGPIIHQDTLQVTHHYSVQELMRSGRDLERRVLSHAVRAHLENRLLLIGKRTIVFHF